MRRIINIFIVLFSVFSLPLLFFYAEVNEIRWLMVVIIMVLIPYMLWWGFYGYNYFFEKTRGHTDEDDEDDYDDDFDDDDDYDDDDYDYED